MLIHLLEQQDRFWGLAFFAESDGDQDHQINFEDESPNVYDVGEVTFMRRPPAPGRTPQKLLINNRSGVLVKRVFWQKRCCSVQLQLPTDPPRPPATEAQHVLAPDLPETGSAFLKASPASLSHIIFVHDSSPCF